jgi:hypothetical protein
MERAKRQQELSEADLLPEYDWTLRSRQTSGGTFDVDIHECGMLKLGERCESHYTIGGSSESAPETGFADRK